MIEAYPADEFLFDAQHEPWLNIPSPAQQASKTRIFGAVRHGILSWELSTLGVDDVIEGVSLSVNHQDLTLCLTGLTTVIRAYSGEIPFYDSYVTDSAGTATIERTVCSSKQEALRGYIRGHEEDRVMFLAMLVSLNPSEKDEMARRMPSARETNRMHPHRKPDFTPCPHNMTQNGFDPTNVGIRWAMDRVERWAPDRVDRWAPSDITRLGH